MVKEKEYILRFYDWVDLIGKDAAVKVHQKLGGSRIYIPKMKSLLREDRNRVIYEEYLKSGNDAIPYLVMEFDLTDVMVKRIIQKKNEENYG